MGVKKKLLVGLTIGMMALGTAGLSFADTWDLKTDWSTVNTSSSPWALNQGALTLLPYGNWNNSGQVGYALQGGGQGKVPAWLKLEDHYAGILSSIGGDFVTGDVIVHATSHNIPGDSLSYDPTFASWTSPINGSIEISGNIWWGNMFNDRSTSWSLYLNGALLDSGQVGGSDPYSRVNPMLIDAANTVYSVHVGDIVGLMVTEINPYTYSQFTGVNLSITGLGASQQSVPEPATMLLFGTGIAGLAAVGRRKRS